MPDQPPSDPKLTGVLSEEAKRRILKHVVLGIDPPPNESPEEAEWRALMEANVADNRAKGYATEIPWDSHDPD